MIDIRNKAKLQEYEANTTLVIITSKVKNKIAGCLLDSQVKLAKMYLNDRYKEQGKAARMRCKYDKIMITYLFIMLLVFCNGIWGFLRVL